MPDIGIYMNRHTNQGRRIACAAAGILLLTGFDQLTKQLARTNLKNAPDVILIDRVLQLHYLENRGAAFGILQNRQWVFLLLAACFIAAAGFFYFRILPETSFFPMRACLVFLISGAAGNLIDRAFSGYVTDFIYFSLIDFPVFNFADICVCCSMAGILYLVFFYYKDEDYEFLRQKRS